ncbi:hypothetical protein [Spartinivicinus poritis]|uniref:Uncharacterized protein n=1 Tax=Spartinivicinus poritis TaxID=2994640 RepID=A0ABT5UA53_9GAMM|nr:hypothetical protein [Spartinivicinus sp. A2-2]MDE1462014.1 hypothetical protein [Spartinivicinus sp. A2-2]
MKKTPAFIMLAVLGGSVVVVNGWLSNQSEAPIAPTPTNEFITEIKEGQFKKREFLEEKKNELAVKQIAEDGEDFSVKKVKPWRKPSVYFQPFVELMDKPLVSQEEKVKLQLLINDYTLLNTSRDILLRPLKNNELDLVYERERLDAVLYLTTILVGKYNSSQQELASDLAVEVLNNRTYQDTLSTDLKKSLVGDKVELGLALAVFQPERWNLYKESYNLGKKHQKLVSYIDDLAKLKAEQLKDNAARLANRLRAISNS